MKAVRTVEGYSLTFKWEGGEYIDISFTGKAVPFEVINTFKDNERIEFTRENFKREIDEWINDPEMSHATDLENYSYG
jgi:hypothetical protein